MNDSLREHIGHCYCDPEIFRTYICEAVRPRTLKVENQDQGKGLAEMSLRTYHWPRGQGHVLEDFTTSVCLVFYSFFYLSTFTTRNNYF